MPKTIHRLSANEAHSRLLNVDIPTSHIDALRHVDLRLVFGVHGRPMKICDLINGRGERIPYVAMVPVRMDDYAGIEAIVDSLPRADGVAVLSEGYGFTDSGWESELLREDYLPIYTAEERCVLDGYSGALDSDGLAKLAYRLRSTFQISPPSYARLLALRHGIEIGFADANADEAQRLEATREFLQRQGYGAREIMEAQGRARDRYAIACMGRCALRLLDDASGSTRPIVLCQYGSGHIANMTQMLRELDIPYVSRVITRERSLRMLQVRIAALAMSAHERHRGVKISGASAWQHIVSTMMHEVEASGSLKFLS